MSRLARAEVFAPDEIAIMHVISRVVRRCFLLGDDPVSKKNIDHRKVWIEVRLQQLAASFGIDLLAFSCHGWWGGLLTVTLGRRQVSRNLRE